MSDKQQDDFTASVRQMVNDANNKHWKAQLQLKAYQRKELCKQGNPKAYEDTYKHTKFAEKWGEY